MNDIRFDLDNRSLKAKFIPPDHPDMKYLLDSGADVPVWCKGIDELKDIAPDAEIIEDKFLLSGFGTGAEVVDVYRLGEFVLSDGIGALTFHNLIVAVADRPMMDIDFVIPLSVFRRGLITIDRLTSATSPSISIRTETPDIHVFFKRIELTDTQMQQLQISSRHILQNVYMQDGQVQNNRI